MELRHLRYFAAVAAHGSFNRAAQNLHLTQPALSRQVKDLEDELGVPLLVRGKNAVTLTDAGELFANTPRPLLSLRQGLARTLSLRVRLRGGLRRPVGLSFRRPGVISGLDGLCFSIPRMFRE